MLTSLVPVLFTFYIQCALKLKKNNSDAKGLICQRLHLIQAYNIMLPSSYPYEIKYRSLMFSE